MGQRQRQVEIHPDRQAKALGCAPIHRDLQLGQPLIFGNRALILDPQGQGDRFADDAKGGCIANDQAAVPIIAVAGHQQMQRGRQVRGAVHIVHLTVGNGDYPRHPGTGFIRQRAGNCRHQGGTRVIGAVIDGDPADLCIGTSGQGLFQFGPGCSHLIRPVRQALTGGFVFGHDHDIAQRAAVFLLNHRSRQGCKQYGCGRGPKAPATQPTPDGNGQRQQADRRQRRQHRQGQQRVEQDRLRHRHSAPWRASGWQRIRYCPSRSRRAGTCTWSDL
ncbi:hypothetical protein TRIHO_20970 [Tritonibacter horizontis]|uniref:Uncharacterized protein n=1 Tax=Tritonibacter horizontis TaxID=1768241 RepID=A0A132BXF8_9RHOB|nr:hypothetical protein TRIHO_20970 [Tritonibacter horizontis]